MRFGRFGHRVDSTHDILVVDGAVGFLSQVVFNGEIERGRAGFHEARSKVCEVAWQAQGSVGGTVLTRGRTAL